MTIKQQIATLPEWIQKLANKYENDQMWGALGATDWDNVTEFRQLLIGKKQMKALNFGHKLMPI